jgi:hypothetical protein
MGSSLACAAQLQAVQASIPVPLQHSSQVWLLYFQHKAWLLGKQHWQH